MFYVCCLLCLPSRSSFVSVVLVFNKSLNDAAPVSPMSLSVDLMKMKDLIVDRCHLCVVSFVLTTNVELSECCV